MTEYLQTAIERIQAMQVLAIDKPDGLAPESFADPITVSNSFPYWLIWAGPVSITPRNVDAEDRIHDLTMRLVMGHTLEDYHGVRPALLNDYVVQVIDYFNARPTLKRTQADTAVPYLLPQTGAAITNATGIFTDPETDKIVCDFTLTIPFLIYIERIF